MANKNKLLLFLGNQLFATEYFKDYSDVPVFMAEDMELCRAFRYHQQKLVLVLAGMRAHAEMLRRAGHDLDYWTLDTGQCEPFENRLAQSVRKRGIETLVHFEIESRMMERRIRQVTDKMGLKRVVISTPMFLTERDDLEHRLGNSDKLLMADFYKEQRRRLGVLVDDKGQPSGGQWSFDADNRRKLPARRVPPEVDFPRPDKDVTAVCELVAATFGEHPGDAMDFQWPVTRKAAREFLSNFLSERLAEFGPYEDAISQKSPTVFHSLLSPLLNSGLLTPREVVEAATDFADKHEIPMQSLEGLIRQIIGWREFVRGVYHCHGRRQERMNFWKHQRKLTKHWYDGSTGIPPLDDSIETANKSGWNHHIIRLMVIGNLMTLCEIQPREAYRWFMEMYVDSASWVMGPNVFGMGIFSDGGLFATKPYICGSNYIRKMSDYKKGDWCDTVDGLYWRFISKHREYFKSNPRLAMMSSALDRMKASRRDILFAAAETFLEKYTKAR